MMTDETFSGFAARHELFVAAHRKAGYTLDELWIDYVGLGGTLLEFEVEGYLAGLMPMQPGQQDVLACVLNERLYDLYMTARVPLHLTQ